MKIYSGNLELYKSGTIQTAFSNSIKFDLDAFVFSVHFKSDDKEKRTDFSLVDNNENLTLDLFNYNTSEASGFVEPVEIGDLHNRQLWFNYRANRVSRNIDAWVMHYFFYLGEKIDE